MLIEAIRDFAERYGRPPQVLDWNPAMARAQGFPERAERFYEDGWPHVQYLQKRFGSFNAGIRAAGFEPTEPGKHGPYRYRSRRKVAA